MIVNGNCLTYNGVNYDMHANDNESKFFQGGVVCLDRKVFIDDKGECLYRLEVLKNSGGYLGVYTCVLNIPKSINDKLYGRITLREAKDEKDAKKDMSAKVYGRNKAGYKILDVNMYSVGSVAALSTPVAKSTRKKKDVANTTTQSNQAAVAQAQTSVKPVKKKKDTGTNTTSNTPHVTNQSAPVSNTQDVVVTDAHGVSVLDRVSLNFFDPANNNNKFYIMELQKMPNGTFTVCGTYGRVGTKGQVFKREGLSLEAARKEYDTKLKSKTRDGYVKIDLATHSLGSDANKLTVDKKYGVAVNTKSNLDKNVQKFITHIYQEANMAVSASLSGSVKSDITAPLGNLSNSGIDKGRSILDRIGSAIGYKNDYEVEQLSIEYYKYIPRQMPSNLRTDKSWLLNNHDKLNKEMDILQLYQDSLRMLPAMITNDLDAQYSALNCDVRFIDDAKTMDYIRDKIMNSRAKNHHFNFKVKNAYEVNLKNAPKFDAKCGNVKNLFHGTRNANMVGILSSHLKLPKKLTGVHITGAMFGPGLYFASDSTKSLNYSRAAFGGARNSSNTVYLFICEVALGKMHKVTHSEYFLAPPRGFNSVMGVGEDTLRNMITKGESVPSRSTSLINNEFIVYEECQQRIKYVVEIDMQ